MPSSPNLAKFTGKFLEDFRQNPEVQKEIRKGTSTEPKKLQSKREDVEVIYKFVAATVEQLRDKENPLPSKEAQEAYLTAMLAAQAGIVRALGLIVDCLSAEVSGKARRNGQIVEVIRRFGLVDIIDEDMEALGESVSILQNMVHDTGLILSPDAFKLVDKNGVLLAKDKYVPTEDEAGKISDRVVDDQEGLTPQERAEKRQATIDTIFKGRDDGF